MRWPLLAILLFAPGFNSPASRMVWLEAAPIGSLVHRFVEQCQVSVVLSGIPTSEFVALPPQQAQCQHALGIIAAAGEFEAVERPRRFVVFVRAVPCAKSPCRNI